MITQAFCDRVFYLFDFANGAEIIATKQFFSEFIIIQYPPLNMNEFIILLRLIMVQLNLFVADMVARRRLNLTDIILGNELQILYWNLSLYIGHLSTLDNFFELMF